MITKAIHHTDWLLILFIVNAVLFLIAKLYHPKKFGEFLSLPFNSGLQEFEKEFNPYGGKDIFDITLTFNSFLIYATGLFVIFNPDLSLYSDFFRLFFILILFFLLKNFASLFIAWLFDKNIEITTSHNANLAYRTWGSIWLYPVLVAAVFIPNLSESSATLVSIAIAAVYILALIVSIFRVWAMAAKKYYKILYLCALEITPIVFLFYWLKSH